MRAGGTKISEAQGKYDRNSMTVAKDFFKFHILSLSHADKK